MWYGGWSLGYRLSLETVPILVLLFCDFLHQHTPKSELKVSLIAFTIFASFLVNTQLSANQGDCGYHSYPSNIDFLNERELLKRLWLDSPILRCVRGNFESR